MKMEVLDRKIRTREESSTGNGFLMTKAVNRMPLPAARKGSKWAANFLGFLMF